MSKKVIKHVIYLKNLRLRSTSPYRKDADKIVAMYENGEIGNIKTASNLISNLLPPDQKLHQLRSTNMYLSRRHFILNQPYPNSIKA